MKNKKEAKELVQTSFLIDRTPLGWRVGKVEMTQGYMKDEITYLIFLLSISMGIPIVGHLQTWMVHFIETIRTTKLPINLTTILSDNLDE